MRTSSQGRAAPVATPRALTPSLKPVALAVALALAPPHGALAAPVGHTVVAGEVSVTQPNAQTMVINQGSDKAILNWRGFSIAAGEKVQFVQPGSGSVALNRVTGGAPSEIFGRLEANGKVFLVNPSGVLFGRGASVDVGGLVASTLGIGDDDFLAGRYAFADSDGQAGAVSNEGRLAAAGRGTIALLGAQVSNTGTVSARLGTVGLAAAGKVTLDFNGDGLTRIVVDAARINALVENGGAIISEGGQVTMTARALGAIADTVVRQQGLVQATGLVERNGRILLDGGAAGKVELAGMLDASGLAPGLRGGDVTLLGRDIRLAPNARIDASGAAGGGAVLVGGDYQGANPLLPHAASTTMAAGATIRADALDVGDGGKVVLWSDGHTSGSGSVSATAGARGGNGGLVETSGHTLDVAGMRVRAGAARGGAGTWLLDPGDIVIDSVLAQSIVDSLNNSTNVTVSTRDADSDGPGDIYVNANIEKTAGGDTTLLLEASRDIVLDDVQIASLGAAGKLNVDFSADWDKDGVGAVELIGSAVLTNGGDVRIYGQDDPGAGQARGSDAISDGVRIWGSTIDTRRGQSSAGASGRIAIAGIGADYSDIGFASGYAALTASAPSAYAAGVRIDNSSLLTSSGDITISGTGGSWSPVDQYPVQANGVVLDLGEGARIASGSGALTIIGTASDSGMFDSATPGLVASLGSDSSISSSGGAIDLRGTGRDTGGLGIDMWVSGGTISGGGALTLTGTGGIRLGLDSAAKLAAAGALSLNGTGARQASSVELSMNSASIRAAQMTIKGNRGPGGAGIRGNLVGSVIETTGGALNLDGTGSGSYSGIELYMYSSSIGATGGDLMIRATGGDERGAGVLVSSQSDGGGDGSTGSNGIMTGSSSRMYAEGGSLAMRGISGSPSLAGPSVAGVELTGIELHASGGDVLVTGAGDTSVADHTSGVALTNVLATTAPGAAGTAAGKIRILGLSAAGTALILDGVALGGPAATSDIIIGGRNIAAAPVFSYPGTSQWANSVQTTGIINLRPDNQNFNLAVPASAIPISVGAAASTPGFNVSFQQLGIGRTVPANVVVGSAQHTGQITFLDATPFLGNLTLQNGGAGSAGIRLDSGLRASGLVTLSSGGAVSAPGGAIESQGLLLHGAQPEAYFALDASAGKVGSFAAWFDQPANPGRPEYGDVSYLNSGPLALAALTGKGFSSIGELATDISAPDTLVAGDLWLRTTGRLTLAQGARTLGGDITLVTGAVLDAGGNTLAPGGAGRWRVFADTWVGENRSGLTPSLPQPNFYNCAYGAACGAAVTGNRFIYRAQPTLTLTPDTLARTYGAANPALTFSPAGLVNGDTLADALSGSYTTTAQQSSRVGAYPTSGGFSSPVGYAINALPGTLNINRAALLVAVDDKSKVYGDADPVLTATFSGLVAQDSAAVVSGLTLSAPLGAAASAGAHAIVGANAVADNYAISYLPGTLTVSKAPLAVLPDDQAKVYGDADPVLTAGLSGLKYGDSGAVVSGLTLATASGAAATAGTHPIVAAGGTAANYTLDYRTGTLRVARAPLLVAVDNKSKVYGAPDPVLSATTSGFKYGDSAAAVSGLVLSAPTGAAAGAGSHPIVAQGAAAANYAISYQPGVLLVDPAVLTYVADPVRQLQGAPQAIPGTVTGFVYADTLASATSGTLQFVALAPALAAPGVYAVEGRGLTAANYRFVQAPSNMTALTTLPIAIDERPTIARNITFESSKVYEKNFGSARLCVGLAPLGSGSGATEGNDPLALEWSRVRVSPNLSNCLGLGQRNGCQDF